MNNLAIIYMRLGNFADAARLGFHTVDARKKIFGKEHPKTIEAVKLLPEISSQSNRNASGIESRKKSKFYLL